MSLINEMPLVSVAIITYNQKKFLKECIESVLAQDYPNFEIVIADDGSNDGTQEMLEQYNVKYPGKFVLKLSKVNQGITNNSNLAHFGCSGKYIAWMGGDDLMLPGKLTAQVKYMEKNKNCSISYHNLDVFDSDTGKVLKQFNNKRNAHEGDIQKLLKYGTFNGACSTMVRTACTPKSGFNPIIPVASDWLYWVETLDSGGEIRYINQVLGKYRRHRENITKKEHGQGISQCTVDHLNTCNVLISKYPKYISEIMYAYANNLIIGRHSLPYGKALLYSLRISFHIRAFFGLLLFVFSFGMIQK